jgi:hypothetical protein
MRTSLAVAALCGAFAVVSFGTSPSVAQYYPYCALDASSGATSCYYSSRAQCGSRCIENPAYGGQEGTMASARYGRRVPRGH